MKIKIIFDANSLVLPKSGVGYFTHGFVQALADAYPDEVELTGHYFNFLGKKQPTGLPREANITYRSTRFFPTKILNLMRRAGLQLPLEAFIHQKSDVVLFPNFVSLPTLRHPCKIVAVHDLSFIDSPEYVSDRNGSFLKKWVPYSVQHADMVITISDFTRSRLMEEYKVPEEKIHVVAIPPVAPAEIVDDAILARHGIDGGYLLFVGNIEPRKNILGLLKAYEKLDPKLSRQYSLVLVGGKGWNDDETLQYLGALVAKGLRIIQTGYVTDAERAALYKKATICIQPSHYEGFGMPILEAMSYGKPVICSNLAVFHEVAGNAALFFDKDSTDEFAASITTVLKDPAKRKAMSSASMQRIASYKTWRMVADDFMLSLKHKLKR